MAENEQKATTRSITITPPDIITVDVWLACIEGRNEYIKASTSSFALLADYAGSIETIKRGFFRLEGDPELVALIKSGKTAGMDVALVGLVVREIATRIQNAVDGPLQV